MVEKTRENMKELLDFGWGDTDGLRQKILSIYSNISPIQFMPLENFGYPPEEGDFELVKQLKKLTQKLTDQKYEFVCVTAGCTHAVGASIFALENDKTEQVLTRNLYYPRYPNIIKTAKKQHSLIGNQYSPNDILLIDSPSNPLGIVGSKGVDKKEDNVIWDAAYHSPTYGIKAGKFNIKSKIFCGSLSKLTGINGIRIGWTATNDPSIHKKITYYAKATACGVSYPSQHLAKEILSSELHLDRFFQESKTLIDNNKNEILRLNKLFGEDAIPKYGMFVFFAIDNSLAKLFEKSKVKFTSGQDCGAPYQSVRINAARTNLVTKDMVDRILKVDRRKK